MALNMNKKVIMDTVAEGEEFDKILFYAEQKSWVFITNELEGRLLNLYHSREYACASPQGNIFTITKEEKEWNLHVEHGYPWCKVSLLCLEKPKLSYAEEPNYLASDPEIIVFLD